MSVYLGAALAPLQLLETVENTPTSSLSAERAGPPLSPGQGPTVTVKVRGHWETAFTVTSRARRVGRVSPGSSPKPTTVTTSPSSAAWLRRTGTGLGNSGRSRTTNAMSFWQKVL